MKPRIMWAVLRSGYHTPPGETHGVVTVEDTQDDAELWSLSGDRVVPVVVREATRAERQRGISPQGKSNG